MTHTRTIHRLLLAATLLVVPMTLTAQRGAGGGRGADTTGGGGAGGRGRGADAAAPNIPADDAKMTALKQEAFRMVDSMATLTQQIVDQVFSYGELGFQEVETSKYLTALLEKNGFKIERGYAGIPTAWVARWGSGKPVLALGSDIDGIPQASQKPGVSYRDPLVAGAPGHGEGHNSGQAVNIVAAFALK
jgi:aminobenzoyl-glutamate utilization protein B